MTNSIEENISKDEANKIENCNLIRTEIDAMLPDNETDKVENELNSETECGWWIFKGNFFQKFANKRILVVYFGLTSCLVSATFSYFNSTITTVEKRFKIPSRTSGIISASSEYTLLTATLIVGYFAGRKFHKPRWMALGYILFVVYSLLNIFPHILFGSGSDAFALTLEYGNHNKTNISDEIDEEKDKMCSIDGSSNAECEVIEGSFIPQLIFVLSNLIAGLGMGISEVLAITYMDDNVSRTETASFISLQYFFRMLGPALGYTLGSIFLSIYIAPTLTPIITTTDPRWMGAWWMGWIVFAGLLVFLALVTAMLPQRLPKALKQIPTAENVEIAVVEKPSIHATLRTLKRLLTNHVVVLNNLAAVFFLSGLLPYHFFAAKYIEVQFRQSAATANLATGNFSLLFTALGVLVSGYVISKFTPSARQMSAWNVVVGISATIGALTFIQLGCEAADKSIIVDIYPSLSNDSSVTCNAHCMCDFVKYSPVCGEDELTYISACHAGCQTIVKNNDEEYYTDCSCISPSNKDTKFQLEAGSTIYPYLNKSFFESSPLQNMFNGGGNATPGPCKVNCKKEFLIFLIIMSVINFFGATGRATNFIIYLRSVDEKDKTAALAFGSAAMCIFAAIPSPIIFGSLLDKFCIFWGKTCSSDGNCWIYESERLRTRMNLFVAFLIFCGTICDVVVWFNVKELNVYEGIQTFGTKLKERKKLKQKTIKA